MRKSRRLNIEPSGALPELMPLNQQMMNQAERELMDMDQQIRGHGRAQKLSRRRIGDDQAEHTDLIRDGGAHFGLDGTAYGRFELNTRGPAPICHADHPDIMKMKQEIDGLEKESGQVFLTPRRLSKRLIDARAALVADLERLGHEHPDILQARRGKSPRLNRKRVGSKPCRTRIPCTQRPENPAYINLQAQLNSATSSLEAFRKTRVDVKRRLGGVCNKRLERAPEIEPEYLGADSGSRYIGTEVSRNPVKDCWKRRCRKVWRFSERANGFRPD